MTEAQAKIREWRLDPLKFVTDVFHAEPDNWQAEGLRAFGDPTKKRISLQACAGPGKSTLLAWCGWHFLATQGDKDRHPNGAAMSITSDNLKDNLWKEFAVWQARSPYLQAAFVHQAERIFAKHHPKTWFISARSWSKTANLEEQGRTLSGLHSKYILYLIDESGDISPAVLQSAEQGLSNCVWGKILQAGNPTSHDGILHAASSEQAHMWFVIRITGDPEDPKRSARISIDWANEQIALYGRDNPWVMAFILGKFPPSSINALLSPDEVAAAMGRHLLEDAYAHSQKRLGVDCARYGDDRTVLFPRQGLASFTPAEMRNANTPDVTARVALANSRWEPEVIAVDGTGGFGAGVIDGLTQAGLSPQEIHFSGKAIDPRYFNKRSEMWFEMAAWVKRGGALPNIPSLARELTTPTYTFQNGKFRLEEKDQIKKRLGFSPDLADGLCLTFCLPEMPATLRIPGVAPKPNYTADYDPFASDRL